MRRSTCHVLAAVAVLATACSDSQLAPDRATAPVVETLIPRFSLVAPPTVCPTIAEAQKIVESVLPQIFGPGNGRRGKAQGYSNNIEQARRNGDTQLEQSYLDSLVNFTLQTYYAGNLIGGQSEATQIRVLNFLYTLYCASSISPIPDLSGIFGAENTVFIRNNTPTTVVSADSAAVQVEQGEVPTTVFGTFVSVVKTTLPLPTSLDWYGADGYKQGAFEFIANPPVTFTSPVLTGVCIQFDDAIVSPLDLRIAHTVEAGSTPTPGTGNSVVTTAGGTIEIGAHADPSPLNLDCDPLPAPPAVSGGIFGKALRQFAKLFAPATAYAGTGGGSTGGQVSKFSPFAAVDIKLNMSSTGPSSPQFIPVGSSSTTAPVTVTVTTRNGATPIDGIAVAFAPSASFAPATATTDLSGTATSTWTLVAGANAATGTPSKTPLVFVPASATYSVTALQILPVTISSTSPLPNATLGSAYSHALAASGGDESYSWSLVGGALPAGLLLSSDGVISGTPLASGTANFTIQVSSAGGATTATKSFALTVGFPTAFGSIAFQPGPSQQQCYALDVVMAPALAVKVTSVSGQPLAGVQVDIVAVTNNGSKVVVSQPSAISGADGRAVFNTLSINKTGAYRLIAGTTAPWPVASVQSGKFNISPAC